MKPSAGPPAERGITVQAVVAHPDGTRLGRSSRPPRPAGCRSGSTPSCPLDQAAAQRAAGRADVRGKYVLQP